MSRPGSSGHQQMDLANASAEPWDWQEDIRLGSNSPLDISHCLWDGLNQIQKDSWCMFDETTPVKDYTAFDYPDSSVNDEVVTEKGMEEYKNSSSQLKRRRMLQFPSSEMAGCIPNENVPSALVKSKMMEDSLIEESGDLYLPSAVHEGQLWTGSIPCCSLSLSLSLSLYVCACVCTCLHVHVSMTSLCGYLSWEIRFGCEYFMIKFVLKVLTFNSKFVLEERCSSGSECMDQSPEEWMMECFNEHEMQTSSDDMNISGVPEDLLNVSEFCTIPPEMEMDAQQEITPRVPHICFTGSPSLSRTPAKSTAPVVYPFTLIKPCGVQGDVTLNDINQRILTPVASKSKLKKNKDATPPYPTSAFSGKPVVALTKIHTEGGRGSITIMRTKG